MTTPSMPPKITSLSATFFCVPWEDYDLSISNQTVVNSLSNNHNIYITPSLERNSVNTGYTLQSFLQSDKDVISSMIDQQVIFLTDSMTSSVQVQSDGNFGGTNWACWSNSEDLPTTPPFPNSDPPYFMSLLSDGTVIYPGNNKLWTSKGIIADQNYKLFKSSYLNDRLMSIQDCANDVITKINSSNYTNLTDLGADPHDGPSYSKRVQYPDQAPSPRSPTLSDMCNFINNLYSESFLNDQDLIPFLDAWQEQFQGLYQYIGQPNYLANPATWIKNDLSTWSSLSSFSQKFEIITEICTLHDSGSHIYLYDNFQTYNAIVQSGAITNIINCFLSWAQQNKQAA